MQIDFTGRGVEVPDEIRGLAERKLSKLQRVLRGISHVHVILAADKHRQIAEVSVHSPHLSLTAAEESGDLGGSLSTVIEKLTRQAQRHTGKLRERKRRGGPRTTALWAGVVPSGDSRGEGLPRIIRSRRFVPKPMTVEEALLEVSASDDGFLVFRDAATERMNVLYRRKDGNLGLIEPEA
ncbi:MAG TPA: ribosome-associated translation inhibitor RaiA [Vicinamibacteria bacterium]|nr:ribosome-associated translation inhibitor RaiA [Vicinamibacteria bacterium]